MMRTYTRKRLEGQYIDGVQQLCRLCLQKPAENEEIPIFTDDQANDICATLALRIMTCVGLEITREESLPNIICPECFKELERNYAFRKKCDLSHQKLKSHLIAVKNKENLAQSLLKKESNVKILNNLIDSNVLDSNRVDSSESNLNDEVESIILTFEESEGVSLCNLNDNVNFTNSSQLDATINELNNVADDQRLEPQSNEAGVLNMDEVQPAPPSITDLSKVLLPMLLELGIVSQQGDDLRPSAENTTIHLEAGDGAQYTLQLVEEEEEQTFKDIIKVVKDEVPEMKSIESDAINVNQVPKTTSDDSSNDKNKSGFRCSWCGRRFASRNVLARHSRVHTGERPYACSLCARTFAQREVMLRHELVHREVRPYACPECPKSFTQRSSLAAHTRSHAAPAARPLELHRCHKCDKVFQYASGLSRHMMSHAGRVFLCGACARPFGDRSSLVRHLRTAHPLRAP